MTYLWLCLAALAAGMVNAVAGGGTLLTFPALLAHVSAAVANGTSTVALLPGTLAGAWGFRRELAHCRRWALVLTLPSLVGGAFGALLVENDSFRLLIPWLILSASLLFLMQPAVARFVRRPPRGTAPSLPVTLGIVLLQFLIAIYGGYFGAGIGILMLSSLSFLSLANIHQANALKNYLAFCINGMAALVFVLRGQVAWPFALAMAGTAIVGGYTGARFALRLRPGLVRAIVIVIGLGLSVFYFARY
jgi:uncharacterized protein